MATADLKKIFSGGGFAELDGAQLTSVTNTVYEPALGSFSITHVDTIGTVVAAEFNGKYLLNNLSVASGNNTTILTCQIEVDGAVVLNKTYPTMGGTVTRPLVGASGGSTTTSSSTTPILCNSNLKIILTNTVSTTTNLFGNIFKIK